MWSAGRKGVKMRGFTKLKMAAAGMLVAVGAFFAFNGVYTSNAEAGNCSGNSVIKCGVSSVADLRNKYNSDYTKGTKTIFTYMGITSNMVNNMPAHKGTINKDGTITYDGKVVAKNAMTSGRYSTPNATKVTRDGISFYTGTTQTRFVTYTSTPVYIYFDDHGRFLGAVMLDCGNPVKATNVVPMPVYKCNSLTATAIDRTTRKFNTSATAKDGARVTSYVYDFGDGNKRTVNSSSTTGSVTHRYAEPGTYTAKVTVNFTAGKVAKSSTCTVKVTIEEEPKTPGVEITKHVNGQKEDEIKVGEDFIYNIKVTNSGEVALKDVTVRDEAPAGIEFKSADKGTIENNVWTYTVDSLEVGASLNANITAVANEAFADAKVNTACVDTPTVPGNPDDCDDAKVTTKIKVCDTETDTIVWVSKSEADNERYTTDLTQCDNVQVCDPETGDIISVPRNKEDQYEDVNSEACQPTTPPEEKPEPEPEPETPVVTEMPKTGLTDTLGSVLGVGSLTAATYYYLSSRRN